MLQNTAFTLPTVTWGSHKITRLLLGHNPIKGGSHFSAELSAEMRQWHETTEHGLAVLWRAETCGINTAQFGGTKMHDLLHRHHQAGGQLQWIATLYGNERGQLGFGDKQSLEEELNTILKVNPAPIGIQHFGECTDRYYLSGQLSAVRERLKRLRQTGLLIGLCSHLPEPLAEAASQHWDVDFYQCSFYTAYAGAKKRGIVDRSAEVFEDEDRDRMLELIRQLDKPCIAFKVLGANRKCASPADVKAALQLAYERIKPSDVVLVGMWQKHLDQIAHNTQYVSEILAAQAN